jgi:hypothetical protein
LALSSADASPPYGFILLPGTISSGCGRALLHPWRGYQRASQRLILFAAQRAT